MPVEHIDPVLLKDDIERGAPSSSSPHSELEERMVLRSQIPQDWPDDLQRAVIDILDTDAWLDQNDSIAPEVFKVLYVKTRGDDGKDIFTCQALACSARETPQSTQARDHAKNHLKFKQFQCEECQRRFVRKQDLTEHEGRHIGSKSYPCEYCNREFNKAGNRNRHSESCPKRP